MKLLYWIAGIALFLSLIIIPSMMSRESNSLVQAMGNVGIAGMVALIIVVAIAAMCAGETTINSDSTYTKSTWLEIEAFIGTTALCISSLAWIVSWLFGIGWVVTQII